jgi:hypothetical protein
VRPFAVATKTKPQYVNVQLRVTDTHLQISAHHAINYASCTVNVPITPIEDLPRNFSVYVDAKLLALGNRKSESITVTIPDAVSKGSVVTIGDQHVPCKFGIDWYVDKIGSHAQNATLDRISFRATGGDMRMFAHVASAAARGDANPAIKQIQFSDVSNGKTRVAGTDQFRLHVYTFQPDHLNDQKAFDKWCMPAHMIQTAAEWYRTLGVYAVYFRVTRERNEYGAHMSDLIELDFDGVAQMRVRPLYAGSFPEYSFLLEKRPVQGTFAFHTQNMHSCLKTYAENGAKTKAGFVYLAFSEQMQCSMYISKLIKDVDYWYYVRANVDKIKMDKKGEGVFARVAINARYFIDAVNGACSLSKSAKFALCDKPMCAITSNDITDTGERFDALIMPISRFDSNAKGWGIYTKADDIDLRWIAFESIDRNGQPCDVDCVAIDSGAADRSE